MANRNDPFFSRLTKLFRSGPAIQRRVKGYDYKSYYDNQLVRGNLGYRGPFPFGRESSPFSVLGAYGILDRMARYAEFAEMEYQPEIAAALNIFADETAAGDEKGKAFHLFSKNPEVKKALEELFYDILNIDFNLRPWIRNLVKYGDFFLYNEVIPDIGIVNVQPIPVNELEREEGFDQHDPYAVRFKWLTRGNRYLENWQVTHMRLLGNDLFLPYGTCHEKTTKVLTEDGLKEIQHIKVGDRVVSFDLQSQQKVVSPVLGVKNSGFKPCFEIRTKHNFLRTSKEHQILIWDTSKNSFDYKSAGDLKTGDMLVINTTHSAKETNVSIDRSRPNEKNKNGYWNSSRYIPENVTPEFARLFGFLLGDGWISGNQVCFANGVDDKQNMFYASLLEQFTGKKPNASISKGSQTVASSKMLTIILRRMGFAGKATTKRIPSWVYKTSAECRQAFLQGMHDADGSSYIDKWQCERRCFELSNYELIKDLKTLAQTLGYKTGKITKRKSRNVKGGIVENGILREFKQTSPSYMFYWFESQNKQIKKWSPSSKKSDCFITEPIIAIESVGSHETYDIYVQDNNHNFYANGIVTHNSVLEPARRIWRQLIMMEDSMLVYRVVRCLHGDTNVWTENGYKKIKDISVGDKVFSYNEQDGSLILTKVTDWINNGPQKIWKVRTKHRTIQTNSNHPILVRNKKTNALDYVLVENLLPKVHQVVKPVLDKQKYDEIPVELNRDAYTWFGKLSDAGKNEFKSKTYDRPVSEIERELALLCEVPANRIHQFLYVKDGIKGLPCHVAKHVCKAFGLSENSLVVYPKGMYNTERVTLPKKVDTDFARFFGFMIGDGSVTKNLHKIMFAAGTDKEQNLYYKSLLESYVGRRANFNKDIRSKNPHVGQVSISSFYFANLLKDMGYISGAHNKRVPEWVFRSSPEIKESFLMGLVDADGHVRTQRHTESYELELCNKKLVEDVKELCHQLGWNVSSKVYSRVRKSRAINKQKMKCKETVSHSIYFTKTPSSLYEDILSIDNLNTIEDVYDIRVESSHHNFIADGIVVHNSPERRVFYIDVGNVAPNDVPSYMEAVKQTMRSRDVVDRTNGRIDQRYNPLSIDEDFYIPVRGGQTGTKIETLAGGQNATAVDDVKYLQQKLFAAIQVPKPYLNFDENLSAKASLAQQDVRFSRTISVLQRVVISELNKMAMIHLYSKGFDGEDLIAFELKLSNPSTVAMQQKLEALSTKFDIAGKAKETLLVDEDWIQRKVLELTEDDIIRIETGRRRDRIRAVEIEAIAVKENLPQKNPTTDPFDPSNYVMPGANVKKNPPVEGTADTNQFPVNVTADLQNVASSGVSVAGQPSASPDAEPNSLPIKANPFLSRTRHNERRRVGQGGRNNLGNPDFSDMLSANNRHMTDITDKETLNLKSARKLMEELELTLDETKEIVVKAPPVLSRDVVQLTNKLDEYFSTIGHRRKKILTENDVDLKELDSNNDMMLEMKINDDDILVESLLNDKNTNNNENDELDLSNLDD